MPMPQLTPASRHREYDAYSDELKSAVVREWLFTNKTHRQIDEGVLGLDPEYSRGWQSMGILHYLGLNKGFHGIFGSVDSLEAVDKLRHDPQDFQSVIRFLTLEGISKTTSLRALIAEEQQDIQHSKQVPPDERLQRIAIAEKTPQRLRVYSYTYRRNPDVVVEALIRANGHCENCGSSAPFNRLTDGSPFLEIHHRKSLSEGGEDTLDNVQALCPNCHRKKHYGESKS